MVQSPDEAHACDLTDLVAWDNRRKLPGRRVRAWAITALGGALVTVGIFVGFFQRGFPTPSAIIEGVVVAITGVGVSYAGWVWGPMSRTPDVLIVTGEAVSYGFGPETNLTEIRWDSPRLQLWLVDRREYDVKRPGRDNGPALWFGPLDNAGMPVPEAAFNRILEEGARHRLTESRQVIGSVATISLKAKHPRA